MQNRIEPGSLVEFNERVGDPAYIGIVQSVWPDGSLQLFVLHFQAAANVRSASRSQCKLIMGPSQHETIYQRIQRLEDTVNFLMSHPVEPTPEEELKEGTLARTTFADEEKEKTAKKPWPKAKRTEHTMADAVADPVPD